MFPGMAPIQSLPEPAPDQPSSRAPSPAQAETPQPPPPTASPDTELPGNDALARCRRAYDRAAKVAAQQKLDRYDTLMAVKRAYFDAMPPLHGAENIRDFIACTAYAMLIDIIPAKDGSKYLYAAQTAYQAHKPSQQNCK
jgi:hypothetical protein